MNTDTRYQRQLDILPPSKCKEKVTIIGAGATGSFVAFLLAKMGMTNITIYDKDTVEEHNFPNQLFPIRALGKNKAMMVKEIVLDYTETELTAITEFYSDQPLEGIVISALDSMKGRKLILENSIKSGRVNLLIDPRTGPEVYRIYTLNPNIEISRSMYEKEFFSDEEAVPLPCTATAIIYSVADVCATICSQVKKYIVGEEFQFDIFKDTANNVSFTA